MLFACEHMCCDIAKADAKLGWSPAMRLDVGLKLTIQWMRDEGFL